MAGASPAIPPKPATDAVALQFRSASSARPVSGGSWSAALNRLCCAKAILFQLARRRCCEI